MSKKFIIPVSTMLAGIIIWIFFIITHDNMRDSRTKLSICILSALLMVTSAVSCKLVNGPRVGSVVRAALLVVMALVTLWLVDLAAARIFLAAAVVPGVMASIVKR